MREKIKSPANKADRRWSYYFVGTKIAIPRFHNAIIIKLHGLKSNITRGKRELTFEYLRTRSREGEWAGLKSWNVEMVRDPNKCPAGAKCRHYTVGHRGTTNVSHRLSPGIAMSR